jgi:lipopolysaccharide biosynthesis protein
MKRLFLFACYDPQGVVGEALLRYLEALQPLGDVVLATDCDLQPGEAERLAPLALSCQVSRHGEYDFGSYKRAYLQADLTGYDVLYLVNDSVVGPLFPLEPYLLRMEALGTDAFGLVLHPSRHGRHLQSWFIGLRPAVFRAPWFREFLAGVTAAGSKEEVCDRYENGLARELDAHSIPYAGLWELRGKSVYNAVGRLSREGFPFLKKSAFTRHGGSLGPAVAKALAKAEPAMAQAVIADMDRLYGEDYRRSFLSAGRLRAFGRYLGYLARKRFSFLASLA